MKRFGRLTDVEWTVGLSVLVVFMLACSTSSQGAILAAIPVGLALGWNYRYYLIDQIFYVIVPALACSLWTVHQLKKIGIIHYEARFWGCIVFVEILGIAVVLSKKRKDVPPPKQKVQEVPEE